MARRNKRKVVSGRAILRPGHPAVSQRWSDSHPSKIPKLGNDKTVLPYDEGSCPNCGRSDYPLLAASFTGVVHCGCYYMRKSKENPATFTCFDRAESIALENMHLMDIW